MSKDTSSADYLELKTEIRSVLISSQNGCDEQLLMKGYAGYNGNKEIPFRRMGFKTLIELLISMPDVARIDRRNGFVVVYGVADQSTIHIDKLVRNQKPNKKAHASRGGRGGYQSSYRPPAPARPRMNRVV